MDAVSRLTDEALDDIQGIITSGYKHLPLAAYLFVTMASPRGAREWLDRMAAAVTSSRRWTIGGDSRKVKPRAAVNVSLTVEGLRASGLPERVLCTFPYEFQEGIASKERSRILGDTGESAPEQWEIGGPGSTPVHAMLLLFAADEAALERTCSEQRAILASCAGVEELPASMQRGYRPETESEPFGFHDGIAQPSIAGVEGKGVPTGEFILGYENHYRLIPSTPVVPRDLDPAGLLPSFTNPYHQKEPSGDFGRNGTFLVYRKLEQNVAGFWQFMSREAARMGRPDAAHAIWLASKCIGRWPSGAPLLLAPDADQPNLADSDTFLYGGDRDGLKCPVGSHVRRSNPRDALEPYAPAQSLSMTEAHRLIRRGRVYGPPLFDPAVLQSSSPQAQQALIEMKDDSQPRGVHFFCVNASLKSQFEFVQQTWCNNRHFGGLNDNRDPLTSSPCPDDSPSRMTIPREGGNLRTRPLPRFVTVKAGAYLFVPSRTALRFLGAARDAS